MGILLRLSRHFYFERSAAMSCFDFFGFTSFTFCLSAEAFLQLGNFKQKRSNFDRAARSCALLFRTMQSLAEIGASPEHAGICRYGGIQDGWGNG